jgi:hypothetical protein
VVVEVVAVVLPKVDNTNRDHRRQPRMDGQMLHMHTLIKGSGRTEVFVGGKI